MVFSRPEYWSGYSFPSPGDLPNPGIEPGSPALQADSLPSEPPGSGVCRILPLRNQTQKGHGLLSPYWIPPKVISESRDIRFSLSILLCLVSLVQFHYLKLCASWWGWDCAHRYIIHHPWALTTKDGNTFVGCPLQRGTLSCLPFSDITREAGRPGDKSFASSLSYIFCFPIIVSGQKTLFLVTNQILPFPWCATKTFSSRSSEERVVRNF